MKFFDLIVFQFKMSLKRNKKSIQKLATNFITKHNFLNSAKRLGKYKMSQKFKLKLKFEFKITFIVLKKMEWTVDVRIRLPASHERDRFVLNQRSNSHATAETFLELILFEKLLYKKLFENVFFLLWHDKPFVPFMLI